MTRISQAQGAVASSLWDFGMAMEKIDLERVVSDPAYRREVIDRLNAEVRRNGETPEDRAARSKDVKSEPVE